MPRLKAATEPTVTERRAARKSIRTGSAPAKTRARRTPSQLLVDLKQQRDRVAATMGARIAQLDERIQRAEERNGRALQLSLFAGQAAEELEQQLAEARRRQRLLRMALKAKG